LSRAKLETQNLSALQKVLLNLSVKVIHTPKLQFRCLQILSTNLLIPKDKKQSELQIVDSIKNFTLIEHKQIYTARALKTLKQRVRE